MVSRGGRCLCSVLILTGFLLAATNGETTNCSADTDCQSGETCVPSMCTCPTGSTCDVATCSTDMDCQSGETCVPSMCTCPTDSTCGEAVAPVAPTTAPVVQTAPSVTAAETTTLDLTTPVQTTDIFQTVAPTTTAFCTLDKCQNGGTCMEDTDKCQCAPGYEGVTCMTDLCLQLGCQNGGTCNTTTDPVSCMCTDSWEGTTCSEDIDECPLTGVNPCDAENGICTNTIGSYTCTCNTGFQIDPSNYPDCSDIDECSPPNVYPCDTVNGDCTNTHGSYNCTCNTGFQIDPSDPSACSNINDCFEGACQNGGTCTDLVNDFNCSCPTGFNGTHCEFDIRECDSTPCKNNGTCFEGKNYFNCTCLLGFNGSYCEHKVAEIANPGYSNVLSMELQLVWDFPVHGNNDDINCTAKYRIQGTNKTEDKNVGSTSPGVVTGLEPYTTYEFQLICVNLAGSSEPLDFPPQRTLAGKPSQPQNVRISSIQATEVFVEWDEPEDKNGPIDGYVLIAYPRTHTGLGSGTSGIFIQLTPNTIYTVSVKVFNRNAPEGNQFSEASPHSDSFTTLQADIDDCSSDPCNNGGTCMDLVNGYTCSCPAGFNGIHCETGNIIMQLDCLFNHDTSHPLPSNIW